MPLPTQITCSSFQRLSNKQRPCILKKDNGEGKKCPRVDGLSRTSEKGRSLFPVRNGSLGPDVLDIRKLYGEGDVFSFDPGFTSTASCSSSITYIDGEAGVLLYRGYPVSQLAEKRTFPEVMHLLLKGELPSALASEEFQKLLQKHTINKSINFTKDFVSMPIPWPLW